MLTLNSLNDLQKKYFPRIRDQVIGNKKPVDHNLVNSLIAKIVENFGLMKVKIVVGQKLFKKKSQEIKAMIEKSSHHWFVTLFFYFFELLYYFKANYNWNLNNRLGWYSGQKH